MRGLYSKYTITKTNGEPIDPEAKYFVLRLDTDKAARLAIDTYAYFCDNAELRKDIYELLDDILGEK